MFHPPLPLLLLLLLAKALAIMTAFALVPSQIPGARHGGPAKDDRASTAWSALADDDDDSSAGDQVVYCPSPSSQASIESSSAASSSPPSAQSAKKRGRKKKISIPRTGNLPDVHWRAISMSHLRSHPNFEPLPPPSMIRRLPTKEHVRYFRQDSWQWDRLHVGRCTTSQAASALGFLEPEAARYLGIPRSLQRGGTSAWDRLRGAPKGDASLEEWDRVLCEGRRESDGDEVVGSWRPGAKESDRLWIPADRLRVNAIRTKPFPFAAKYIPNLTCDELYRRKLGMKDHHLAPSPMKTRMQWGNAQEATSILTALNYFCGEDGDTTIQECGMCGAGFDDVTDPLLRGVKIGASPDAIIRHANGTAEVLEVKNHCPFVWNRISPHYTNTTKRHASNRGKKTKGRRQKNGKGGPRRESDLPKNYLIRDFRLERRIPPVYIPQLMMEMLCVDGMDLEGSSDPTPSSSICSSAIMVRQTATKGAILLRLHRDEEWIREMKYWLGRFKAEYVDAGAIPPDNFFYDDDPDSRYHKFLHRTKELSESVEQVAFVDHARIQRMVMDRGDGDESKISLFLDRVDEEGL